MIYRVLVRTTEAYQPQPRSTFWLKEVVYCGTSAVEARVVYLREIVRDLDGGPGGRCRETEIQAFEEAPANLADDRPVDAEETA